MFRTHFDGFKCFNVRTRMMQYWSKLHHAQAKGKCVTQLRASIASSKCHTKHVKPVFTANLQAILQQLPKLWAFVT